MCVHSFCLYDDDTVENDKQFIIVTIMLYHLTSAASLEVIKTIRILR